jgi:hypothetical protein
MNPDSLNHHQMQELMPSSRLRAAVVCSAAAVADVDMSALLQLTALTELLVGGEVVRPLSDGQLGPCRDALPQHL